MGAYDQSDYGPTWYSGLTPLPPPRTPLNYDLDVDVCVIGGGLAGLTVAREVARRPDDAHLIYDFLDGVMRACAAKPTRVVLEYAPGVGLGAMVTLSRPDGDVVVPCYLADGLALAHRTEIPIFVSTNVFSNV